MTAVQLTPAQAKKLGLDTALAGDLGLPAVPTRKRTTRKVARGPYATICVACGERFDTQASETRHLTATGHCRYQLEFQ